MHCLWVSSSRFSFCIDLNYPFDVRWFLGVDLSMLMDSNNMDVLSSPEVVRISDEKRRSTTGIFSSCGANFVVLS